MNNKHKPRYERVVKMFRHSTLEDHKLHKGKFITPLNAAFGDSLSLQDWTERLPEYLWLGLILNQYGRTEGLQKCRFVLQKLVVMSCKFNLPFFSNICTLSSAEQAAFWEYVKQEIGECTLEPLTVVFSFAEYPAFNREFQGHTEVHECVNKLQNVLTQFIDCQSENSTDIRFLIIFFRILRKQLVLPRESAELLARYPLISHSDPIMLIRPLVRSCETSMQAAKMVTEDHEKNNSKLFWERISVMTECDLVSFSYQAQAEKSEIYVEYLHEIFQYLESAFIATEPLDQKHLVILGMATFSYKRIKELSEHQLFNEISGRSIVRNLIEIYIMLKYLLAQEVKKPNIWNEYRYHGIGAYKLVVERNRSKPCYFPNGHVNYDLLEILVNEYCDEEVLNMDTGYFNTENIRKKAEAVGEKELYGLFYDYDSSFEHGLWGAVRESALLTCRNPAHQFHNVLDCDDLQKLPSVWKDCVRLMNMILGIVNNEITIPVRLMDEVKKFE